MSDERRDAVEAFEAYWRDASDGLDQADVRKVGMMRAWAEDAFKAALRSRPSRDEALEAAYLAGFNASGEVWNGDYPFGDYAKQPTETKKWCDTRDEALRALQSQPPAAPIAAPGCGGPDSSSTLPQGSPAAEHSPDAATNEQSSVPGAVAAIQLFRTRVGDSLEVLDAIREALAGQDKGQIVELVNGYIDRARADLTMLEGGNDQIDEEWP